MPSSTLDDLLDRYAYVSASNKTLLEGFARVAQLFQQNHIPFVLLKGADVLSRLYGVRGIRPLSDVDLLVREEDVPAIDRLLLPSGFVSQIDGNPAYFSPTLRLSLDLVTRLWYLDDQQLADVVGPDNATSVFGLDPLVSGNRRFADPSHGLCGDPSSTALVCVFTGHSPARRKRIAGLVCRDGTGAVVRPPRPSVRRCHSCVSAVPCADHSRRRTRKAGSGEQRPTGSEPGCSELWSRRNRFRNSAICSCFSPGRREGRWNGSNNGCGLLSNSYRGDTEIPGFSRRPEPDSCACTASLSPLSAYQSACFNV